MFQTFTVEGGDNSFKTTYLNLLLSVLQRLGLSEIQSDFSVGCDWKGLTKRNPHFIRVREPGGSQPGKLIRKILLESTYSGKLFPPAYAFGYYFDRGILYGIFQNLLINNPNVLLFADRCDWTTITMQLNDARRNKLVDLEETRIALTLVREGFWKLIKQQWGEQFSYPQRVYVFDVPAEESLLRAKMMEKDTVSNWRDEDSLESMEFIRKEYVDLVKDNFNQSVLIDTLDTPDSVLKLLVYDVVKNISSSIRSKLNIDDVDSVIQKVIKESGIDKKWKQYMKFRKEQGFEDIRSARGLVRDFWKEFGL